MIAGPRTLPRIREARPFASLLGALLVLADAVDLCDPEAPIHVRLLGGFDDERKCPSRSGS